MDEAVLAGFLASAVRVMTPLLLAALGETVAERGGVINLGIEGMMLAGALGAALGAANGGLGLGAVAAIGGGLLLAVLFAAVAIMARADQIIAGAAVTLIAVGLTGVVHRRAFGLEGTGLDLPTFPELSVPGLVDIPILGAALFRQPAPTYLALALVPTAWWLLFRTRWGPAAPGHRGISRSRQSSRCSDPALSSRRRHVWRRLGRIGRRHVGSRAGGNLRGGNDRRTGVLRDCHRGTRTVGNPGWVLGAAFLFGLATALQFLFQALGTGLPYQLFLMLPYVLALVALGGGMGRARAPAGLGRAEA